MPIILAVAALALAMTTAVAQARPVSGNSAADQYIEAIPTAGGAQSSPPVVAPGAQPAAVKNREATSALAKATAPSGTVSGGTDSSGMGIVLPLIMVASLIGASILYWTRRRRAGASVG